MLRSLNEKTSLIPDFSYLPEQTSGLYEYVVKQSGFIYEAHGFAKYLDIPRFVEMYFQCTPAQMDQVRGTFIALYRPGNIESYLADDRYALQELIEAIEKGKEKVDIDKVQQMQCRWFINNLNEAIKKLS